MYNWTGSSTKEGISPSFEKDIRRSIPRSLLTSRSLKDPSFLSRPQLIIIATHDYHTMLSQLSLIALVSTLASASPLTKRAPAFKLHPAGDQTLCLGVPTGTTPADGTALYNIPCNSALTGFEIAKGDNQVVRLTGTNFCLDAGSSGSSLPHDPSVGHRRLRYLMQLQTPLMEVLPSSGPATP